MVFSTLDLSQRYHQSGMAEKNTEKTAFSVVGCNFEYATMPFGLSTAPQTFQRLTNTTL